MCSKIDEIVNGRKKTNRRERNKHMIAREEAASGWLPTPIYTLNSAGTRGQYRCTLGYMIKDTKKHT